MADASKLVLIDPDHAGSSPALWRDVPSESVTTDTGVESAFSRHSPSVVILHGGDALVSRALSVWYRSRRRRASTVHFVPVPVTDSPLGSHLASTERLGKFAKVLLAQGVDGFERVSVPSLCLVDSGLPFRRIGFTAGFGLLTEVGLSFADLADRAISGSRDSFRLSIDGKPSPTPGYLLASTLPTTVAKIPMGDGATYRAGDQPAALLPQTTRLGRLVSRATGIGAAKAFSRIHIDGASGYLLDDVVQEIAEPGVIELRAGPRVPFVRVR